MLFQKVLYFLNKSRNDVVLYQNLLRLSTSAILTNKKEPFKKYEHNPEKLKIEEKLYGMKLHKDRSIISDDYVDKKNYRRPFFEMNVDAFKLFHADIEYTPHGIAKFVRKTVHKKSVESQECSEERTRLLGHDIAAAYFVITHNGKVKFKHSDGWIGLNKEDDEKLPKIFNASYIITEIDMSDLQLYYEGLMNFQSCPRITKAIFQRSPYFDEWFADRLTHLLPNLEYLDLTDCPKVTERALEAFYKLSNLKTLIVTNHHKTAAFELTCMMLEDIIPGLIIKILEPKEKKKYVNKNQS